MSCSNGWGASNRDRSKGGYWDLDGYFCKEKSLKDKRFVLFVHALQGHWSVYLEVDNMATINWLNKQTGPTKIIPRLNIGIFPKKKKMAFIFLCPIEKKQSFRFWIKKIRKKL